MIWYKDFYAGEAIASKKEKIKWKIQHKAGQLDIYVIALGSAEGNLLDIIPSWELMQKYYPKMDMLIVGVDKGYDNAMELAGRIVTDVYKETGTFAVKEYFLEKHRENLRKEPVWKSCS